MLPILILSLVLADQFSITDLLKRKELNKGQVIDKLGNWLSKSNDKQKDSFKEETEKELIDSLIQELEKEQDEIPIEWMEMEESGPTRVLRVNKPSKSLIQQIHVFNFDVWHLSREYVDVLVQYDQFNLIGDLITEHSPESVFQVLVTDVDEMIAELGQAPTDFQIQSAPIKFDPSTWFNDYHPYEAIMELFDTWTEEHSDVMTKHDMGESFEKRKISAFHIKPNPKYTGDRKRIYIQSLVHAREWYLIFNVGLVVVHCNISHTTS